MVVSYGNIFFVNSRTLSILCYGWSEMLSYRRWTLYLGQFWFSLVIITLYEAFAFTLAHVIFHFYPIDW